MAISGAEVILLSQLATKVTEIVCGDCTFVDVVKKTLNFAIAFEKEYSWNFVSTRNVDIMKYMIGSDFLTKTRAYYYRQYIRATKMILRYENIHALLERLNGYDEVSKRLGFSCLDDIWM